MIRAFLAGLALAAFVMAAAALYYSLRADECAPLHDYTFKPSHVHDKEPI